MDSYQLICCLQCSICATLLLWNPPYLTITGNYQGNLKLNEQSYKWGQTPNHSKECAYVWCFFCVCDKLRKINGLAKDDLLVYIISQILYW